MSFKAIDMQIAVQKSTETGMKQNQLMNKPVLDQVMLAANLAKRSDANRLKSGKVDELVNHLIRDDQENGKNKLLQQARRKKSKIIGETTEDKHTSAIGGHPFKGKHIDFSL